MIEMRTPENNFDFDFFDARRLAADKPLDSDNGEVDDSDADKSYNPYGTKDSNNESSSDTESIGHVSTILNKNDTEIQLYNTITSEVNNVTDDIPDLNILNETNNHQQIGYSTPSTSKSATIPFITPKPSTSSYSVSTPSAVITSSNTKYEIKSLSYSIETIKSMTAQILDSSLPKPTLESDISEGCEIMWPIENTEDMDKIRNVLASDTKIRKNQAIILSRLVGSKINETVRRIMQRMFLDIFIKDYSYVGFKGKNKFQGLNCCNLLFESIRMNKKFEMTSDEEISSAVSKWMAQATNRINQKNKSKLPAEDNIFNVH
ncbi:uncharacterized protein LOC126552602 [Aphis gossypii]|uniref:uncharacterized protein LOC126552602 n=1 Tax=Aphis gossypii TaxID=80765 RepID=UPI002158BD85|nr:uncharacterized protein LOC126552602 [Aphis gossypii]